MTKMKKHTTYRLLFAMTVAFMAFVAASCTHNNGDIRPWYGIWHIDNVESDTTESESLGGIDYFFNFQAHVIVTRNVGAEHDVGENFGNWEETDGQLVITFSDPDRGVPPLPGFSTNNMFTIEQRSDKLMVLRMTGADGMGYRYTLRKVV